MSASNPNRQRGQRRIATTPDPAINKTAAPPPPPRRSRRAGISMEEMEAVRKARGDVFEVTIGHRKFKVGDELIITGQGGNTVFKFRAARVVDGVVKWVEVQGGKKRPNEIRFFEPTKIARKKRTTREAV